MPKELTVDTQTGATTIRDWTYSPADLARLSADNDRAAAEDARQAARAAVLADTPASVNSIPLLRAEIDAIKALLR